MALIFLRHTQPDIQAGICYGVTDLQPATSFEADAKTAISDLPRFDRILSSPLQRCSLLAQQVASAFDLPFSVDERLREMNFGGWEMQPWDAIPRHELDAWAQDFANARPHGGESVAQLYSRVSELIGALQDAGGDSLLVTHAGVIKSAFATELTASSHSRETEFGRYHVLEAARTPGAS